ncbi:MAG: polyprenyl synthetase family protein [Acidobacteriota bacterium]|nr:polyprenyl synthetase family protein [Acidobacteriota bacterium]
MSQSLQPSAAPTETFFAGLAEFQTELAEALGAWLGDHGRAASAEASDSEELTSRLSEFVLRGGKRLRPALVHHAYAGCGGEMRSQVLPVAMSLELFHTYLLIHDDIMDRAETRRGARAVHLLFRDEHLERGWSGDAERGGEAVAILLGDLAHSYAVELFLSVDPRPDSWDEVTACFSKMCQEVVVGQYLEMTAPYRSGLSEDELLRVLRMKSGRYSVERPIQLGALLAGAGSETISKLRSFGLAVGEAFQLKDDLLGVFGDLETVGKPVGSDLVEGKFTVLIHHTLEAADDAERRAVNAVLGNSDAGAEELAAACRVIEGVGARSRVEEMVETRMEAARHFLSDVDLRPEGANFFAGLVGYLKERRH